MRVQTFSIVAGTALCNAKCPFCVSKMTPPAGINYEEPEVNWRNFRKAARLAQLSETTTVMITSKGEPTLYPTQISKFLKELQQFSFPIIELQTNGILIATNPEKYKPFLKEWYNLGLNTIAISIVSYDSEKNRKIYLPYEKEYPELKKLIELLHSYKFSVRLATVLTKGNSDTVEDIQKLIEFAKSNKVEQLTLRPVVKPEKSQNMETFNWVSANCLTREQVETIINYIESIGVKLMDLMHGATVYDVNGQNVCISNALTLKSNLNNIRQLIFFPDGHLRYDWQYEGAILI